MESVKYLLSKSRFIEPRVGQLDANILDSELLDLLKSQLYSSFKYFHPEIKDKYEPELLLLLKLLLFKVTIWDHSATYGSKLQNLKLVDSRSTIGRIIPMSKTQKLSYGLLIVGGSYFWNKLEDYLARTSSGDYEFEENEDYYYDSHVGNYVSHSGDIVGTNSISRRRKFNILVAKKLRVLADGLSTLWAFSSLANFILFLYSGRYSTLILRLLRIRYVPGSRSLTRQVNFEFQNRQLVWNALTEFLLFVLPLVNMRQVKRKTTRAFTSVFGGTKSSSSPNSNEGELAFLPEKTCPICYKSTSAESTTSAVSTDVTNPYHGECGHLYCYVCLTTALAEDPEEGFQCLRCNSTIKSASRYKDIDLSAVVTAPPVPTSTDGTDRAVASAGSSTSAPSAPSEGNITSIPDQSNISDDESTFTGSDEEADYAMDDEDMGSSNFFVDEGDEF
ncbi:peroxisomal biogenesis factor 2 [Sugiyamaella lignohabitans]|uniref:RING-type E3 ubiquitin transferase (cysteine targeting) n=1 Tax=Sugiyamaella lignohabitans TaxID=796027 RepID=A0A167FCC1_9ASCO|nr:peroxisomal biogenesis factor 2 [Sugiyamaella lignohabitans]ANB15111.1 peroxisomal biogenesis factor 2 [Sugiyamaella lignohabitans]